MLCLFGKVLDLYTYNIPSISEFTLYDSGISFHHTTTFEINFNTPGKYVHRAKFLTKYFQVIIENVGNSGKLRHFKSKLTKKLAIPNVAF